MKLSALYFMLSALYFGVFVNRMSIERLCATHPQRDPIINIFGNTNTNNIEMIHNRCSHSDPIVPARRLLKYIKWLVVEVVTARFSLPNFRT